MALTKVYCSFPQVLTLELGTPGKENYKYIHLRGHGNYLTPLSLPDRKGVKFGLSLVDSDFWAAWLAANSKLRYVVDQSVVAVP